MTKREELLKAATSIEKLAAKNLERVIGLTNDHPQKREALDIYLAASSLLRAF